MATKCPLNLKGAPPMEAALVLSFHGVSYIADTSKLALRSQIRQRNNYSNPDTS